MPPLSGSIVAGQLVPFPANPLRPGEPNRVRLSPEGRVNRGQTYHCPSKYVNVSADGRSIARLPWLSWQQSTVYAPGCNPGFGVVAREPLNPGDYGSEYGGKTRSVEEVVDMKPFMQHTHIKAIYTQMSYWDSRWINGKPTPYSDLPPIREYLEGHYMAGLMNSAFLQQDCNCEFVYKDCQARPDMDGLDNTRRCFAMITKPIQIGEELLVWYGHDYFYEFGLPTVAQP